MGKRPFRANYSQMVPALFRGWLAGPPCVPRGWEPSKGWRRSHRARSLVRLCIGSRLPRATVSFTIIYDIAVDLFSPYGARGGAASHARARRWASVWH